MAWRSGSRKLKTERVKPKTGANKGAKLTARHDGLENRLRRPQAWAQRDSEFQGEKVYFDQDYSPDVQKKRKQVREVIKKLRECNIKAKAPYPAQLRVLLDTGIKTFPSLYEAQPTLRKLGVEVNMVERDLLERESTQGRQGKMGWTLTPKEIRSIVNGTQGHRGND